MSQCACMCTCVCALKMLEERLASSRVSVGAFFAKALFPAVSYMLVSPVQVVLCARKRAKGRRAICLLAGP
ncbi:MAG: hypothetical protein NVS2B12_17040 [Ktedonobacteraceae bacterium]